MKIIDFKSIFYFFFDFSFIFFLSHIFWEPNALKYLANHFLFELQESRKPQAHATWVDPVI